MLRKIEHLEDAWLLWEEGLLVNNLGRPWEKYSRFVGTSGYKSCWDSEFVLSAAFAYVHTEE